MRLAIFDFDETVVGFKTMFRFLAYADPGHAAVISEMQDMSARGMSRSTVNRYYYRRFAGITHLELANKANAWFEQERRHGLPLITWTCAEITRRRASGDRIVIVTGSFPEAIAPFRSLLGIDEVLAANLEVIDGKFTGDLVGDPVIGEGKAKALLKYATEVGADLSECSAYGDHGSDVAMLSLVKEAIAVNPCPQLRAHAVACGWAIVETSD